MKDERPKCHWCGRLATKRAYRTIDGITGKFCECGICFKIDTEELLAREYGTEIDRLKIEVKKLKKYKKGFNIMMNFWDYIPEDSKQTVDNKLIKLGL